MSYLAGGNFLRLDCGVKQWVYTSVATKLCCSGALLCGAVLLRYCGNTSLSYNTSCYTTGLTPEGILRGCVLIAWHTVIDTIK